MSGQAITRRGLGVLVLALAASRVAPARAKAAAGAPKPGGADFLSQPLRGVATGDPLGARAGRPASDYAVIAKDWSATCVRLSVHPGLFRDQRARMTARLDEDVRAALDAGLRVVIDWHAIGWPGGLAQQPGEDWELPADLYDCDLSLAQDFWSMVADRYGGEPRIAFELWNEPVDLSRESPFAEAESDWHALRPVWDEMIGRVRRKADNYVLATGGSWAADLTGIAQQPLNDVAVGYSWHVYPDTGGGEAAGRERLLGGAAGRVPIFVTEWGFAPEGQHQGTSEEFGEPFLRDVLDRYAMSWTAWCWHPSWTPALLQDNWRTPTPAGAFVRSALAERRT